jgi:hypothetical protein
MPLLPYEIKGIDRLREVESQLFSNGNGTAQA